jgi:quercetin dioxygenase-like cupin family protein
VPGSWVPLTIASTTRSGVREYFTCLDGCVNLMVAGERYELATGDVLAFPGNQPHSYQNADALKPARGVSVVVLAKAGV